MDLTVKDVIKDIEFNKDAIIEDVMIDSNVVDFGTPEFGLLLSDIRYTSHPTGAIRYALTGLDAAANRCILLVIEQDGTFCFDGPQPDQAFAFIKENATNSDCWNDWFQGGALTNVEVTDRRGCVQFSPEPNTNNIQITIESPNYNKTVRFF